MYDDPEWIRGLAYKNGLAYQREYLQSRIDTVREVLSERIAGIEQARNLQAIEIERRLEGLNHEGARLKQSQSVSVSRELFDSEVRSVRTLIESRCSDIVSDVESLKNFRANLLGKAAGATAIIALLISIVVSVVVKYLQP